MKNDPITELNTQDRTSFYYAHVSAPPGRLRAQSNQDGEIVCIPVSEFVHVASVRRVLAGEDIRATEYTQTLQQWATPDKFSALIESMRSRGFDPDDQSRISVAINPRGQLVILDGLHRASVALALGLDSVPLLVAYRSEEWQTIRLLLVSINKGLRLYQPIDHPDLAWPAHRIDTAERARLIYEHLTAEHGPSARGIDLACHTGGLTFDLAFRGIDMIGLDTDSDTVRVANLLRAVDGVGCERATFEVCSVPPLLPTADFVVCLSLLNHCWADPARQEEGVRIFWACVESAPLVFLDAPAPGDEIGGASSCACPEGVFHWCSYINPGGSGCVVARRGEHGLQRDLLAWGHK